MTPINQGMYEFKNDSLIEIRKRIGISQSKMAELLEIPANTLSRWETGNTVPDASSLAAIYSLAKEHGISDIPTFFGIRKNPLEVRIGSKPPNQPIDSLSLYQSFRYYLNTHIELIGNEQAPDLKVEIRNTAPVTPGWPKIVFIGVGLSIALTGRDTEVFRPKRLKTRINHEAEDSPSDAATTPWQHDIKMEGLLKIEYSHIPTTDVSHQPFHGVTAEERQYGEVLFPGQSIVYEMDVTAEILPYLQFRVEGVVSQRHLLHCEEIFSMPENITKPLALTAFSDFNMLDLHGALESVVNSMPKFDNDTRLEEIQSFSSVLSDNIAKIKVTQEELNKISRQHKIFWFRAHLRAAFIYLNRVNTALSSMKEAMGSNSPDKISADVSAILALRGESTQLNRETQELMRRYNISEEELRISTTGDIKAAVGTAHLKAASSVAAIHDIPDELDLHGKTVDETIVLVDKYLEDIYSAKKHRIWIVHGKGTGVLRQAVGEHLRKHKLVKSFTLADSNRGGDGATQVDLVD